MTMTLDVYGRHKTPYNLNYTNTPNEESTWQTLIDEFSIDPKYLYLQELW